MENQETKISNVTTSMKVEKEINGFKVSGTVEVYNDSKRIKRIDASVQKNRFERHGTFQVFLYGYPWTERYGQSI